MEESEIKDFKKQVTEKFVLHIRYIVLISLLICIFVVLIAPNYVTDEAFKNFSFAATITSIVLAVVSIVYSFYSSGGLTMSVGEMKQVEKDLEEEIRDIPNLKNHVSNIVDELKTTLLEAINENRLASEKKTDELFQSVQVLKSMTSQTFDSNSNSLNTENKRIFDYSRNSRWGNKLVYCLYKSITTGIPLNLSIVSPIIGNAPIDYLQGFIVGLCMDGSNVFAYTNDDKFITITVTKMDKDYFQLNKIDNLILNSSKTDEVKNSYKEAMDEISRRLEVSSVAK